LKFCIKLFIFNQQNKKIFGGKIKNACH
jgi:hypothetical protein